MIITSNLILFATITYYNASVRVPFEVYCHIKLRKMEREEGLVSDPFLIASLKLRKYLQIEEKTYLYRFPKLFGSCW